MAAFLTHQQFIEKANLVHNSKYLYFEKYVRATSKIKITCTQHGEFLQLPSSHLYGNGCPKCANKLTGQKLTKNNACFLKQALLVHGNKYEYISTYVNTKNKIKIKCSIHGIFTQLPSKHLAGEGCLDCGGRRKKLN